jgi:hypothetical protein
MNEGVFIIIILSLVSIIFIIFFCYIRNKATDLERRSQSIDQNTVSTISSNFDHLIDCAQINELSTNNKEGPPSYDQVIDMMNKNKIIA